MFYHDQDLAIHLPASIAVSAVFILDPKLLPGKKSPLEEEVQDSKLLHYYPGSTSIHTKRNHVGLAEGIMMFTDSFGEGESDSLVVDADTHALEARRVEGSLMLAVLSSGTGSRRLVDVMYKHFCLLYGKLARWRGADGRFSPEFATVFNHFVTAFVALGSTSEAADQLSPQRLLPVGVERFGLQKSHFLVTNQIENILKVHAAHQDQNAQVDRWMLFYKSFFIYGDLDYLDVSLVKEYLFGFGRNPHHMSYLDKFTDFRKCHLEADEGMKLCTYGLLNLARETKEVLAGELGEGKDRERFVPHIYLPKRQQFEQVEPPSTQRDYFELLSLDRMEGGLEGGDSEEQDGLVKYELSLLKFGNFTLVMLNKPGNSTFYKHFNSTKASCRAILEHCERLVLNQLSLVESAAQKKASSVSAMIFNQVNQAVVYYPLGKFNIGVLPAKMVREILDVFDSVASQDSPPHLDVEIYIDGHHAQITRWNQRTMLIYTDDKKLSYKEVISNIAAFKQSLSDIFL